MSPRVIFQKSMFSRKKNPLKILKIHNLIIDYNFISVPGLLVKLQKQGKSLTCHSFAGLLFPKVFANKQFWKLWCHKEHRNLSLGSSTCVITLFP